MSAVELRRANKQLIGPVIIFLPGIIAPAEIRYTPLIREFGDGVQAFTKDLEVYDSARPSGEYSIDIEIEGLVAAANQAGIDRFFLYGHSAGGAISIAFAWAHPERVLGLGLDEPASDFAVETKARWARQLDPISALPANERLPAFMRAQVASGVELPAPPAGDPPDWMASRPAGVEAFVAALDDYQLNTSHPAFDGPVYYSFGTLTNPIWREIEARLSSVFPNFTSEEYEGLHHLNTSHAAEPARVAAALQRTWSID